MTDQPKRCRYIISACLSGIACRYDRRSNFSSEIASLVQKGLAIPVCPEVLGGLPVPRAACEICHGRIQDEHGGDKTEFFVKGALIALRIALDRHCTHAILKARSPSCGHGYVYDGTFSHTLTKGNGIFADMLMQHGIRIFTEETFVHRAIAP